MKTKVRESTRSRSGFSSRAILTGAAATLFPTAAFAVGSAGGAVKLAAPITQAAKVREGGGRAGGAAGRRSGRQEEHSYRDFFRSSKN